MGQASLTAFLMSGSAAVPCTLVPTSISTEWAQYVGMDRGSAHALVPRL